jgi:dTDP-4-dehydrorhamnose 3,5-epimerase-like enzyme
LWNDSALAIRWPDIGDVVLSEKDASQTIQIVRCQQP